MKKYSLVALAGTFDLLHHGHKDFINFALNDSEKVILGLTSDKYVEKNKPRTGIGSFDMRQNSLETFLYEINAQNRVEIVSIDDAYGPAISPDYLFDALFVTEETKKGGEQVNKKRVEMGLLPLPLEIFHMTRTEAGSPISSTKIREEIFSLPPTLRKLLQDPFGEILSDIPQGLDANQIITVGDTTTKRFIDSGLQPFLAIIDNRIERKEVKFASDFQAGTKMYHIENDAARINGKVFTLLDNIFETKKRAVIIVEGEEDLLVLPTLLSAPLGFTIFYGQPHVGLVRVDVIKSNKKSAQDLLDQFDTSASV